MSLTLRSYDPGRDRTAFAEFVRRTYGERSFLLSKDYVGWWFSQAPARNSDEASDVVLAWHDERLAGMNAHIATSTEGLSAPLYWLANTMVLPEYRSRGVGVLLLRESVRRYANLGSISFRPDAARLLEHTGFSLFEGRRMRRAVALTGDVHGAASDREIAQRLERARSERQREGSLCVLEAADLANVESAWRGMAARYGIATRRSAEYLAWRYSNHPSGSYRLFGHGKGALDAFCALRLDGADIVAARIVDAWGEADALASLLTAVLDWAYEAGTRFADFFCTGCPDVEAFQRAGFAWLEGDEAAQVPFLLMPLDTLRPYHEQLALRLSAGQEPSYADTFFTRGDSDRDRPPLNR